MSTRYNLKLYFISDFNESKRMECSMLLDVVLLEKKSPLIGQPNELIAFLVVFHLNIVLEVSRCAYFDIAAVSIALVMRNRRLSVTATTWCGRRRRRRVLLTPHERMSEARERIQRHFCFSIC